MSEIKESITVSQARSGNTVWPMTLLTLTFVCLYLAALIGWLRPVSDLTMVARLEPILFLIFGYYFGRLPSKQNEKRVLDRNDRLEQKLETAIRQKEQAQNEREAIEEKIRNAKVALRSELIDLEISKRTNSDGRTDKSGAVGPRAVETAINILNS